MIFRFKDIDYTFPSSLDAITLRQRIAFNDEHGKHLDDWAKAIAEMKDEFKKEGERSHWHLDNAARMLSFYTGIPFEQVSKEVFITDLLYIYNTQMQELFRQEAEMQLQNIYSWNDEDWYITTPELKPTDNMALNEFIVSKEIVRMLNAAGQGKWDMLPYLCAIYLRRKDEPFSEELVQEGSERLALMQDLPLDIAIAVGFFLSGIVNTYTTALHSLEKAEQRESQPVPTSTNGDG